MQTSEKAISRKLYFSGFSVPLIQDLSEGVDPREREGNSTIINVVLLSVRIEPMTPKEYSLLVHAIVGLDQNQIP